MEQFYHSWAAASTTSAGFFWMALWAFALGYLVSSLIQVLVTRERMQQTMGESGAKSVALGTFFGFISSSCSFAALSTTRALFQKGAGLVPAIAFLLASTNLVIELGIVIAIFLSWQFVVGEYLGGILLILLGWLFVRLTRPESLIQDVRDRLSSEQSSADNIDASWKEKVTSVAGWREIGTRYVMEWQMVWKDVLIGFTAAGVIAVFVPDAFFESLFVGSGGDQASNPGFAAVVSQIVVGPIAAFFTMIGSMGNIPLAALLYDHGVSFAGVMAFIFSDLVVLPVVRINAEYYGWRMALYILALLFTCVIGATLLLHYGFVAFDRLPETRPGAIAERDMFKFNYGFSLNLVFLAVSGGLGWFWWTSRRQSRDEHEDHDHGSKDRSLMDRVLLWLALAAGAWLVVGLLLSAFGEEASAQDRDASLTLWYDEPAIEWTQGLPIGNGRLGAMVFGRTSHERIQINEESLWGGRPFDDNNPGALEHLPEIRSLIFADQNAEAYNLATRYLLARPQTLRSYQTLMDVDLRQEFADQPTGYRRELDLRSGTARTAFTASGVRFVREVFASAPDDIIVVDISAGVSGSLDLSVGLTRVRDASVDAPSDHTLVLSGQILDEDSDSRGPGGPGMRFAGAVRAFPTGGQMRQEKGRLVIEGADSLLLIITGATNYNPARMDLDSAIDPTAVSLEKLAKLGDPDFQALKARHTADHESFMDRVSVGLGGVDGSDAKPTDERLADLKAGGTDPGLIALYFQYGRYLLLGSSRAPGQLPANLQGIWNEHIAAPWESDYHTNINLQMNYWHAEVVNLPETVEPLIEFVDRLRRPGRLTARAMYGAGGWTMHHNTDIFGRTGLHDAIHWGTFPMGGPWMTFPVWRHFSFGRDLAYLRDTAYPIMKESAEFVLDFLVEGPNEQLVTTPSYSPENAFVHPTTGEPTQLTYAPTMDTQIATELFKRTIAAATILGIDPGFCDTLASAIERLPPTAIGRNGTIQEWIEDYAEAEPGHRHMSHLFSLYPGNDINSETPVLFTAARSTLDRRLAHGGGHTGWSRAWIINFFARLQDGERAYENLLALLRESTLENLFDTHPPFQIDGNFGGTAGIAEMLIQSHQNAIDLLPAIPDAWSDGYFTGLRARGGFEVDASWTDGTLTEVSVRSRVGGRLTLTYDDHWVTLTTEPGAEFRFNGQLARL